MKSRRKGAGAPKASSSPRFGEAEMEQFISAASHELKTPLTSLRLLVDMLGEMLVGRHAFDAANPARVARISGILEQANRQVSRLNGLLNDMVEVSRIATQGQKLTRESVDLGELVRDIVAGQASWLKAAGCEIRVSTPPAAALGFWDRARIERMLGNLLSNASKYGQGKPVEITLEVDESAATLRVRDHGPGLSGNHARELFESFERAEAARGYRGLGLGLWIASRIARAHEGSIRAEAAPSGDGTVFVVRLPRKTHREAA